MSRQRWRLVCCLYFCFFEKLRKMLRKNRPIFCDFENFFCKRLIIKDKKFCQNGKSNKKRCIFASSKQRKTN